MTLRVDGVFEIFASFLLDLRDGIRFSIADIEGNVGWSPTYTVRVPFIDSDGDGMDDHWERT